MNKEARKAIKEAIKIGDEKICTSKWARQAWNEVKDILREKYNIEDDRFNYMDIPFSEDPIGRDRKRWGG